MLIEQTYTRGDNSEEYRMSEGIKGGKVSYINAILKEGGTVENIKIEGEGYSQTITKSDGEELRWFHIDKFVVGYTVNDEYELGELTKFDPPLGFSKVELEPYVGRFLCRYLNLRTMREHTGVLRAHPNMSDMDGMFGFDLNHNHCILSLQEIK